MATLTLTATTDFRPAPDETDITDLIFGGASGGKLVATFAPEQFAAGLISPTLAVQGGIKEDILRVIGGTDPMNFSAAGWTFTNWKPSDSVMLFGSGQNDVITGSSMGDLIRGFDLNDALSGGAGSDT